MDGGDLMFLVLRAKRIFMVLCLTIFTIGGIIIACNRTLVPVFAPDTTGQAHYYIIDAGHGGEDGGAVSGDGIAESDLNLSIAVKTEKLLSFLGKNTAMTRNDGNAVYTDGAATLREKKRSDLENRVSMVNEYTHATLISIHQNSLPSVPAVHGAQVFYNAVEGAQALAEQTQQQLNQSVNLGNEKAAKEIDSSIYLMQHVNCPAILIECGFLSNSAETQLLQDAHYQTKLAAAIVAGILRTTNGASS